MCEFVSWIEHEGHVYFLKNSDLDTKEGKKLLKAEVRDDLCGHGAIMAYYPELTYKGKHKECEDFSTQKNFPKEIANALKNGEMSRIGINGAMLTDAALAEYSKVTDAAWSEYSKVTDAALAEYSKVKDAAYTNIVKQKKNRSTNWK